MTLFGHHASSPDEVRDAARGCADSSVAYLEVAANLNRLKGQAAAQVDGDVLAPVTDVFAEPVTGATTLSNAAVRVQSALTLWASTVETFNRQVDTLNDRYESSARAHFGVPAFVPPDDPSETRAARRRHDDQVASARSALLRQLNQEYELLCEGVDEMARYIGGNLDADGDDWNFDPTAFDWVGAAAGVGKELVDGISEAFSKDVAATVQYTESIAARAHISASDLTQLQESFAAQGRAITVANQWEAYAKLGKFAGPAIAGLATIWDVVVDHEDPTEAVTAEGAGYVAGELGSRAASVAANAAWDAASSAISGVTSDAAGTAIAEGAGTAVADAAVDTAVTVGTDVAVETATTAAVEVGVGLATDVAVGAAAGSVVPVVGTIVGAAVGLVVGVVVTNVIEDHWTEISSTVGDAVDAGEKAVSDAGKAIESGWKSIFGG